MSAAAAAVIVVSAAAVIAAVLLMLLLLLLLLRQFLLRLLLGVLPLLPLPKLLSLHFMLWLSTTYFIGRGVHTQPNQRVVARVYPHPRQHAEGIYL